MKTIFPTIKPTKKQYEGWEALWDKNIIYLLFGGACGGGKSWLGCEWLLTSCYQYPGTRWFIGRKELSRVMKSSYITFTKVCQKHKIPQSDWKLNGQYNYIEFSNGSRIDLLDLDYKPSDPMYERFGSLEYTGGWIEEAGEVNFGAFDILKSRIGRHLNQELDLPPKMLITCNPSKNWLYRIIYKPFRNETLAKEYAFIQSLYGDNPFTADYYGKMLAQLTNKATKQRLMFGNWEYDEDPNKLMEYDAIQDLFTNSIAEDKEKYLTADIARYGQDKTVVGLWEGLKLYRLYIWTKQGLDITSDKIKNILIKEKIPYSHCAIDEIGIGAGVVDGLNGVKGFVANSIALENPKTLEKENYKNLKVQCSYILAQKVNNHEISIKAEIDEKIKEMIIEELDQIRSKDIDKDTKLQLVPKDEVKEMLGRSPDLSDMLIERMYFELDSGGKFNFEEPQVEEAFDKFSIF